MVEGAMSGFGTSGEGGTQKDGGSSEVGVTSGDVMGVTAAFKWRLGVSEMVVSHWNTFGGEDGL